MMKQRQKDLAGPADVLRLVATICSIACFAVPVVFAKLPEMAVEALHITCLLYTSRCV